MPRTSSLIFLIPFPHFPHETICPFHVFPASLDHVPSALYLRVSFVMSFSCHALADVLLKVLPVDILLEGISPPPPF